MLTTPERMRALEHLERGARRMRTPGHALINQLDAQAGEEELGGTLRCALADRLRITKADAGRRIAEAEDLGERRALTGEPLTPRLCQTAAAQRDGLIGDGHVKRRNMPAHGNNGRALPVAASGYGGTSTVMGISMPSAGDRGLVAGPLDTAAVAHIGWVLLQPTAI